MLDKTIHKHLDEMDKIYKDIDEKIDAIIDEIDIDELMESPSEYLHEVVDEINNNVINDASASAIKAGEAFAKSIEKKDEIVVDDSTNPRVNNDKG